MSRKREMKRQNRINNQNQMTTPVMNRPDVRLLPDEMLWTVDYQRPIRMARVQEIVDKFNPLKVNILKVSFRDGKYYVFDGAHTLSALKIINNDQPFEVLCQIFHNLTYEMEAELFASQYDNAQRVPFKYELSAHLKGQNPDFEAFKVHTENAGLHLALNGAKSGNSAIHAMEKAWVIYRDNGPEFYEKMLKLIAKTWNGAPWSLQAPMLGGLATFIKKFPDFSPARFVKKLSEVDGNSIKREASSINRCKDTAFAVALARIYNAKGGRYTVNADLLVI